jgi:energy-coupling factor transporter ATP-binding protein EcfA2
MMDKLGLLIKEFEDWLQKEGKKDKDDRNTRLHFFQDLKDKIINDTITESEILEIPDKIFSIDKRQRNNAKSVLKDNFFIAKNMLKEIIENGNKGKSLDEIIKKLEETNLMIDYFKFRQISELLCLFYPERYWIINKGLQKGIEILNRFKIWTEELNLDKIEDYKKLGELLTLILEKLRKNPTLKKILERTPNYYDADAFLWHLPVFVKDDIALNDVVKPKLEHEQYKEVPSLLVKYFISKGFYFDEDLITAFYAALKTKGFVILSGLTGTGKTKLAQLFAELLCPNDHEKQGQDYKCTHRFLSVRPDWRDSKALLGYYNPITGKYESTDLLDFILKAKNNYEAKKKEADPYFIILDEMNLSHVEYYFADFLSVLESGRDENKNYLTKETIKLHNRGKEKIQIPEEIELPPNLYIIGSVNIDETTYMFSPKVLDRAFTIEFREVNFDDYLASLQNGEINLSKDEHTTLGNTLLNDLRNNGKFCAAVADKNEIKNAINVLKQKINDELTIKDEISKLNQILQPHDLHFGYRVLDEIALFIKYAIHAPEEVGKLTPEQALDFAVLMKVLPKFHGPRQKLERPLWLVLNWCLKSLKNRVEFKNKKSEELIKGIWKELKGDEKRPITEDLIHVIQELTQELKLKLNNIRESESQEANHKSQTIDGNQSQTKEETQESTSEANQTEQTSKTEKARIIDKFKYPRTALKVLRMLKQLYETGFASFV